ncbi:hypothetical protein [Streptomyces ehimensis]|uniref:Transcriptional regulator n=1 Tax=Streptomyces ehimensis TaxID=68195 RepID=A0ABV9BBK3_9ACTN
MGEELLLQVLVAQRQQTYEVFAQDYQQAAEEVAMLRGDPSIARATVAERTFRRWTSGRVLTLPQHPAPLVLRHMYGYPVTQLFRPAAATPLVPADIPLLNESDITMTARDAAAHATDAASLTVPDTTLDQLQDDIARLAREYSNTSPLYVHGKAQELLLIAQNLLERTQKPRQREYLYLTAGQAAAVMSAAAFDLGLFPPATQLARTAALYGEVIEHGPLQAYANGMLACLASWDGRPAEAVRLVHKAQTFGGLGAVAVTRLAVIEGRAYAHLGDHENAERALRTSLEPAITGRDDLHDDLGGEFGFAADRVVMGNATTCLLLNDSTRAEASASHALDLLAARPANERPQLVAAQAAVDLARARMLRGELAGAGEALQPVFQVPAEWRGIGVVYRLGAARAELTRADFRGAREAIDLGEKIEAFTAVAVSKTLPGSAHPVLER